MQELSRQEMGRGMAFYHHRHTGRLSRIQHQLWRTEPRGCKCPSRAVTKAVADAPAVETHLRNLHSIRSLRAQIKAWDMSLSTIMGIPHSCPDKNTRTTHRNFNPSSAGDNPSNILQLRTRRLIHRFSNPGLYTAGSRSASGTVNYSSTLGRNYEVA